VKTAAAAEGNSLTRSAKSGRLCFRPHATAENEKPRGKRGISRTGLMQE
jgi:hypothetical protein